MILIIKTKLIDQNYLSLNNLKIENQTIKDLNY